MKLNTLFPLTVNRSNTPKGIHLHSLPYILQKYQQLTTAITIMSLVKLIRPFRGTGSHSLSPAPGHPGFPHTF